MFGQIEVIEIKKVSVRILILKLLEDSEHHQTYILQEGSGYKQ